MPGLLDLSTGGVFNPPSILTHFGGFLLGLVGTMALGLPPGAWWKAVVALAFLQLLTRWTTPPAANVNLAFAVWGGWERWFPSHHVYLTILAMTAATVFLAVTFLLRKTGVARPAVPL